ncbi:lpxB [Acrasis kona]|uniref:LpxB n=1 Tax=Acrasis kona TaxID=1008807 RepID=A0AAW2ZB65_9EUKA
MSCCSVKNVAITIVSCIIFSTLLIAVDVFYLSKLSCKQIHPSQYNIPSRLISTHPSNFDIIGKDFTLQSKNHYAVECKTPASTFNYYDFEGVINSKTNKKEGPGSTQTDSIEFDVWYSNDVPNGNGWIKYKATAFEEEGEIIGGSWKDGKLECKKCDLFMYLDPNHQSHMIYTGSTKNNFIQGQGTLKMVTKSNDGTIFPFTLQGLHFNKGNSINVNKSHNVTITLSFENNSTRTYKIIKMNNLWSGLMDRFRGEKCEVVYLDPNGKENKWDCDDAMVDRMDENYRIRGVLVNLVRFELYWSTKAMRRIPNYNIDFDINKAVVDEL